MGTSVQPPRAVDYGTRKFSLGDELRGERATLGKTLLDVQRDLRIKAAYIAAIEDCKPEVFPNPSFIPGYVRSYARHLGLDPEEVYRRFCQESGFAAGASRPAGKGASAAVPGRGFRPDFPLTRKPARGLPAVPVAAIGSVLVLGLLLTGLGYGGWLVLQNFQRVQFAPVEDLPVAVAEVDPLAVPETTAPEEPTLTELARPVAATDLAELYRQQETEVPILVPRDGPIAALDPALTGVLARVEPELVAPGAMPASSPEVPAELIGPAVAAAVDALAATPAVAETPGVTIVAERPAWVRVYLENKTVIFERILESGETYALPEGVQAPLIWAGNSGSVYVRVGDTLRGPLGTGTRAAKDVALEPTALAERFPVVENVPEVISQSASPPTPAAEPAVAIQ
jgi:cytoskeletal protein RodZ